MTLGMFSLSITSLETKIKLGDIRAKKVFPLRKNGSLLLTTLLFGNVAVNTAIAIILNSVASGFIAGIISTIVIVLFGEVLPQALFARHALTFGSKMVWLIKFFIIIFYPFASPIAYILDKFLGKESPVLFSKQEFSEIIKHHEDAPESVIDSDEERILLGALSFSDKQAYEIMTPRTVVHYLNKNSKFLDTTIDEIKSKGFSRIPIYDEGPDNIIGILFVKDLIGINLDPESTIEPYIRRDNLIFIEWQDKLDKVLNLMVKKHNHIALVTDEFGVFNGIVTLEDIVEEILKIEIVDEMDKIIDMQRHAKDKLKNRMA